MEYLIAVTVGLLVSYLAYQLWPLPAGYWGASVNASFSIEERRLTLPFWRALLVTLGPLAKFTPMGLLKIIEQQLYWAQLDGKWLGCALPEVAALHLALAVGGALAATLFGGDLVFVIFATGLAPVIVNLRYLRNPARRVRQKLAAELPEFVSLLSAEVGANIALSEAIVRLASGPGVCSAWFRRCLALGGSGGLLSGDNKEGVLRQEALRSGDSDLIGLATSLDNVSRRGTGTRQLLEQIAVSTASRYVGDASARAERVSNELLIPMMAFFFLPFVALLMLVMGAPILAGGLF
jgi:pilus assembly protein TadC